MQFGMLHLLENPVERTEQQIVKEQMAILRAAEDLGFDSVWPAEHHLSEYGYCVSTAMMLAALTESTKRIRLGTGIVVLPFHNPIRVAEEFALLDLMSDGRVDFGIGRGYQPHEFRGYGVDQAKSRGSPTAVALASRHRCCSTPPASSTWHLTTPWPPTAST